MNQSISIVLAVTVFSMALACTSDDIISFSGGYFLRNEGAVVCDILCEYVNGGVVPSTVIEYKANKDFILAKQIPKIPQDPLYEIEYEYPNGYDSIYYWIIVIDKHEVFGPYDKRKYSERLRELNVPFELDAETGASL